ncbi:MAG: HlyC/CorC family transporter [Deltaproteobacteria bacterium]|nr:HlyC/CorC family transporter [Deltaproteobacteria bacterium]MBI2341154.1 HlyC/CorC family transporter [Deltaproteobacteria bacterium]
MVIYIIIILILLLASAAFSCSETALFTLTRSQVAKFKSARGKFSRNVIEALANPRKLLVSILLGNEIVNVAIAILVASLIYGLLPKTPWEAKVLIAVAISTPLIIVFGEVIPKNVGVRFSSYLAISAAIFIRGFSYLLTPIRRLLLKLADKVVAVGGGDPKNIRSMIMEEEFRRMVDLGLDEGSIGEAEGELIHHILDLADKTVEDLMTPKEAIFSIPLNADINSAMAEIRTTQFSRIPIYDSNPDDIVGVLHTRDLFSVLRRRKIGKIRDVENIIRPANFYPLNTTLEQMLREFQKLKIQMAVIVDKQRIPTGVITMEDIFGALFGG